MPRSRIHSTSKPGGVIFSCWRIRAGFTLPPPRGPVLRGAPSRSILGTDRLHRTGLHRLKRPLAQRRVDLPLPAQDVFAELGDLGRAKLVVAVALAGVHVRAGTGHTGPGSVLSNI